MLVIQMKAFVSGVVDATAETAKHDIIHILHC